MDDVRTWRLRARARLVELGLSFADFARLTGLPDNQVYGFFSAGRIPPISVAGTIAEGLGVSLDWLLGINEPRTRQSKEALEAMYEKWRDEYASEIGCGSF